MGKDLNKKVVQLRMKIFVGKYCLIWVKKKCSRCTKQYNLHQIWIWNLNWIGAVFVKSDVTPQSTKYCIELYKWRIQNPLTLPNAHPPPRPQDSPRVMFEQD